jgi:hypothetical protein
MRVNATNDTTKTVTADDVLHAISDETFELDDLTA